MHVFMLSDLFANGFPVWRSTCDRVCVSMVYTSHNCTCRPRTLRTDVALTSLLALAHDRLRMVQA